MALFSKLKKEDVKLPNYQSQPILTAFERIIFEEANNDEDKYIVDLATELVNGNPLVINFEHLPAEQANPIRDGSIDAGRRYYFVIEDDGYFSVIILGCPGRHVGPDTRALIIHSQRHGYFVGDRIRSRCSFDHVLSRKGSFRIGPSFLDGVQDIPVGQFPGGKITSWICPPKELDI